MNEHEINLFTDLRLMLRRYHFHGGDINISREDAPEYERVLALAAYELGLLDSEVAIKVYGFGEVYIAQRKGNNKEQRE